MLDPWALRNSRWKKELSALAYEGDCLRRAACIQANSEGELASARSFGLRNPICVIPNGIDIPNPTGAVPPWNGQLRDKKILLYLGRLHPKKGLVNLLTAWKNLHARSHPKIALWRLIIAGWSQLGHDAQLRELANAYGLEDDVTFTGPLYDAAKSGAYEHAHAVVLPSYSEGLPMSVLEAWSYRKPVLMTPQCNLPEGFAASAAIEAQPDEISLTEGLAKIIDSTDEHLSSMGARGLDLVKRKFTWSKVADEMLSVYRWLVGGGTAPECVIRR
jgi:poly(glycerol-phosphate) alpha-glucosyltransferase